MNNKNKVICKKVEVKEISTNWEILGSYLSFLCIVGLPLYFSGFFMAKNELAHANALIVGSGFSMFLIAWIIIDSNYDSFYMVNWVKKEVRYKK